MKICAVAIAALLVAGSYALPIEQQPSTNDDFASIVDTLGKVIEGLGGIEGAMTKLEKIVGLLKTAYEDQGVEGWIARTLIKAEIEHLKKEVIETEDKVINHLLDELEEKIGMKSSAYGFTDSVSNAIKIIRENIQQILDEIKKAQKEHDEAMDEASKEIADSLQKHIGVLKEKLKELSKKLLDIILRRNQSYALSDTIEERVQKIREKIRGLLAQLHKAREELREAAGEGREALLKKLEEIKEELKNAAKELVDAIKGKGDNAKLAQIYFNNIEFLEGETTATEAYGLGDEVISQAIKQLRERILGYLEKIRQIRDEAKKSAGQAREELLKHIEELKEQLKQTIKQLRDAILKQKHGDETYEIDEEYFLDELVQEAVKQLRERILGYLKQLKDAKNEFDKATGDMKAEAKKHIEAVKQQIQDAIQHILDLLAGKNTQA